ncbi:hypothetical protein FQN50_004171 [Emmonsiellopsis sp. PD_5]|nr:hypothetical protein FQN50_004171 [Emmonsiellopsis sp. PD_5]
MLPTPAPNIISPLVLVILLASPILSQDTKSTALAGQGVAERYWDCCKPDCSWEAKANFNQPVLTCNANNKPQSDFTLGSSCGGGNAFSCANQSPWAVNDTFSLGFSGVFITEHASDLWCCACYELTFTSGAVKGKKMVVQAHNSAFDIPTVNRFPIAVPGGNTSYANACALQYDVPSSVFGVENQGVESKSDCDNLPEPLQRGCRWRFDWFEDEASPTLEYKRITCPATLTDISGCIRADDTKFGNAGAASPTPAYSTLAAGAFLFTIVIDFLLF